MERRATVARIEGDFAFLKLATEGGGCGRCSEAGGCSSGVLNQVFGSACRLHKLPNPEGAAVGEEVVLVTPDGVVWRAALVLYGLPLVLGMLGAMFNAGRGDGPALMGFGAGLVLGFLGARALVASPVWHRLLPRIQRVPAQMQHAQHKIHWSKDAK